MLSVVHATTVAIQATRPLTVLLKTRPLAMAAESRVTFLVTALTDAPMLLAVLLVLVLFKATRLAIAVALRVTSHVTALLTDVWMVLSAISAVAKDTSLDIVRMPLQQVVSKADQAASREVLRQVVTVEPAALAIDRCNAIHVEATVICRAIVLRGLSATTVASSGISRRIAPLRCLKSESVTAASSRVTFRLTALPKW